MSDSQPKISKKNYEKYLCGGSKSVRVDRINGHAVYSHKMCNENGRVIRAYERAWRQILFDFYKQLMPHE